MDIFLLGFCHSDKFRICWMVGQNKVDQLMRNLVKLNRELIKKAHLSRRGLSALINPPATEYRILLAEKDG